MRCGKTWPRIPLPAGHERLRMSAELGRQLAALLDGKTPASGVTAGKIRSELRVIVVLSHIEVSKSLNSAVCDLDLTSRLGPCCPGRCHRARA